jgi:hypothetical protein
MTDPNKVNAALDRIRWALIHLGDHGRIELGTPESLWLREAAALLKEPTPYTAQDKLNELNSVRPWR